jgi:hypothetical protein
MTTTHPSKSTAFYDSIKLGIHAHAQYYWVSRQVNGATPQPVQKMTYEELMLFVVKQQELTDNPKKRMGITARHRGMRSVMGA